LTIGYKTIDFTISSCFLTKKAEREVEEGEKEGNYENIRFLSATFIQ